MSSGWSLTLRGMRVVVVDDGSAVPVQREDFADAPCDVEVLRHPVSRGPAAARNTGLAACDTDFVAFLDSDVVPRRGWLEALLGHFCDPAVALVAPRIVGLTQIDNPVARYETVRSSLDLGHREAPVVPYGTVSYVPSAAIICRRAVLQELGGFDESMHSGEDVDLCWRLVESGARLRYEPIALVGHEHRTQLRDWLARKAFYGASAAPLSVRHPDKTAPMVISGMDAGGVGAPGVRVLARAIWRRAVGMAVTGRRISNAMRAPETQPSDVAMVAAQGLWAAALQLAVGDLPALLAAGAGGRHGLAALPPGGAGGRGPRRRGRLAEPAPQLSTTTPSRSDWCPTWCSNASTTWPTASGCGPV